ncbi:MAG: hypothetical protein KJ822_11870 [Proteobacteria bacterium]|nr:hypothetical protein [Pseudomonadota bacterium]
MNPEIFAEWLKKQGQRVLRTDSSYWVDCGFRVFQAFPYHWLIQPGEKELSGLLKSHHVIGLRYSTPLESPEGCLSYHAVYESNSYDFDNLGKWGRKNVRRGLKNCHIEPISFKLLAEEGWRIQLDTLDRQGRKVNTPYSHWAQLCLSAADLPGFTAWGAIVEGLLAASVITFQMQDCCYMLYQQCLREYLTAHVNNALSFVVTQTMVSRPGVKSILYGLHSLDAPASVDEFKFRMGYTPKPVRQRVVFHPCLKPVFNRYSHAAVQRFLARRPGDPILAKAEGMMRFYLEGKRPLAEQQKPECLKDRNILKNS